MTTFTRSSRLEAIREDKVFQVSKRKNVAKDATFAVLLELPSNPDPSRLLVGEIDIQANAKGDIDYTKDVSVDTSGTSITPNSLLIEGDASSSAANAEHGGTYSGGSTVRESTIPSGGKESGGTADGPAFVLMPNTNLLIEVTNSSSGAADYSIHITFEERF